MITVILATIIWFGIYLLMVTWCFSEIGFNISLQTGVASIWWLIVLLVWIKFYRFAIEEI